jgi:hypothetical protein
VRPEKLDAMPSTSPGIECSVPESFAGIAPKVRRTVHR